MIHALTASPRYNLSATTILYSKVSSVLVIPQHLNQKIVLPDHPHLPAKWADRSCFHDPRPNHRKPDWLSFARRLSPGAKIDGLIRRLSKFCQKPDHSGFVLFSNEFFQFKIPRTKSWILSTALALMRGP